MRTLDAIAAEHWTIYQQRDIDAMKKVQEESIAELVAMMRKLEVSEDTISRIVQKFWMDNPV